MACESSCLCLCLTHAGSHLWNTHKREISTSTRKKENFLFLCLCQCLFYAGSNTIFLMLMLVLVLIAQVGNQALNLKEHFVWISKLGLNHLITWIAGRKCIETPSKRIRTAKVYKYDCWGKHTKLIHDQENIWKSSIFHSENKINGLIHNVRITICLKGATNSDISCLQTFTSFWYSNLPTMKQKKALFQTPIRFWLAY